ncbi:MAG: hypothetical protein ACR2H1_12140, partial [Limisphaerales bacterium]
RRTRQASGLRSPFFSLRWHLAGMSAAWLLVAVLNFDHSSAPTANIARENSPSSEQRVMALRENRRQLAALLESPGNFAEPIPAPRIFIPRRRSEVQFQTEMV